MTIRVWNNLDHPIHLRSFDGDTIQIGPKAKGAQVPQKFSWQIPDDVRWVDDGPDVIDPTKIVKGLTPHVARRPPRSYNKAGQPIPENTRTAAQIRAAAEQKKRDREGAQQRAALAKEAAKG